MINSSDSKAAFNDPAAASFGPPLGSLKVETKVHVGGFGPIFRDPPNKNQDKVRLGGFGPIFRK